MRYHLLTLPIALLVACSSDESKADTAAATAVAPSEETAEATDPEPSPPEAEPDVQPEKPRFASALDSAKAAPQLKAYRLRLMLEQGNYAYLMATPNRGGRSFPIYLRRKGSDWSKVRLIADSSGTRCAELRDEGFPKDIRQGCVEADGSRTNPRPPPPPPPRR